MKADSPASAANTVTIPDAHLLFSAQFDRLGQDLLLTGDDGRKVIVEGYFRGDKHPTLLSPEGASLPGALVDVLAGHAQYAQAAAPGGGQFIGRVEKASGVATVIRNGVTVAVNVGDSVYKGDVVQTGSNSALGISFTDGSAFNVTANARMVLSDFVYDPSTSAATELFNLVQGTATFISGQVAKSGGMQVVTPTATMGIRGTAGTIQIAATDGTVTLSIHDQQDGNVHVADIIVGGRVIGQATSNGGSWTIRPSGPLQALAQEASKSVAQLQQEIQLVQQILDTQSRGQGIYQGPQQQQPDQPGQPNRTDSQPGSNFAGGSSTPPDLLSFGLLAVQALNQTGPRGTTLTGTFNNPLADSDNNIPFLDVRLPTTTTVTNTGSSTVTVGETPNQTGVTTPNTVPVTVPLPGVGANDTITATLQNITWAKADGTTASVQTDPGQLTNFNIDAANQQVIYTYSVPDNNLDFLAEGETLTVVYTITDPARNTSRTVSIVLTGTEDAPMLHAGEQVGVQHELVNTVGSSDTHVVSTTLNFTDVDRTDTHVALIVTPATGAVSGLPTGFEPTQELLAAVAAAGGNTQLETTLHDSTGSLTGSGSIDLKFTVQDNYLDFLAAGETLTLTYVVQLSDFHAGGTVSETVVLTFQGENDAPQLLADASGPHSIAPDETATGTLAFTDVDLTDTHTVSSGKPSFAWSGGELSYEQQQALAAASSLDLTKTDSTGTGAGSIAFAYSAAAGAFDFLGDGETLTITYYVKVQDGETWSTQPITITVTGTNNDPTVTAATNSAFDTAAQDAGTLVADGNVLSGAGDPDANDSVVVSDVQGAGDDDTVAVVSGTAVAHGTYGDLLVHADGSYSYEANDAFDALTAADHKQDQFTFTVSDGHGGTASTTLTIDVDGANDTPVVFAAKNSADDSAAKDAGTSVASGNVLDGDSDRDAGDVLSVSNVQGSGDDDPLTVDGETIAHGAYGNLIIHPDGSYSYEANAAFDALTAGQHVEDHFSFTVSDGHGGDVPTTLTISIDGTNDTPVVTAATNTAADTAAEDDGNTVASGNLLNGASDRDGDDLAVTKVQGATDDEAVTFSSGTAVAHGIYGDLIVSANGSYSYQANDAFDALTASQHVQDAFSFTVSDGHGGTTTTTLTISIDGANDVPAGVDTTVTVAEDGTYTFTAADFGFSDPRDIPADTLAAVKISSLPGPGTLKLDGIAITATQIAAGFEVSAADLAAGKLTFSPAADAHGEDYASFTFQVRDSGGTASGGNLDPTPNTITIDVTSVNDPPTTTNASVTTNEDTAYIFKTGDFPFSDTHDSPPNALLKVIITSLPSTGTLTLNGAAVTLNQAIAATDIAASLLVFTPAPDANGTGNASFSFKVEDNGGGNDTSGAATMTVNVTSVNDPPTTANSSVTTNEDTAYTFKTSDFPFSDPNDAPANSLLKVIITSLPAAGTLTLNGVAVAANQAISAADIAANKLVFTPAADANGPGYASFSFKVEDNGGGNDTSSAATMTVNVTAVNDPPATANASVTTNEDTAYTFKVSDFPFSDTHDTPANSLLKVIITSLPAAGTLTLNGVAVAANQAISAADIAANKLVFTPAADANGTAYASFSFKVEDNGGGNDTSSAATMTVNVTSVNDPPATASASVTTNEDTAYTFKTTDFPFSDTHDSPANSLLKVIITALPSAGTLTLNGVAVAANQAISAADIAANKLVFTPAADANGTAYASFSFKVEDNGGGNDTSSSATMTVNVTSVNDAPTTANAAVSTNEDTAYIFKTTDFPFSDTHDTPANSLLNVIITALPSTGTLTLNGVAVTLNQAISAADIAANKLAFTPAANGSGSASFSFKVEDSGGTANGGADTSSAATMTVNVAAVDDAPVNTVPGTQTINEDTTLVFKSANGNAISVTDVDAGGATETVTLSVGHGTLSLASTAGLSFATGDGTSDMTMTFTGTIASINAALSGMAYKPFQNYNGGDTLTITTNDNGHTGAGGPLSDTDTVAINVSAVNDAPVILAPDQLKYWTGSATGNVTSINKIIFADADAGSDPVTVTLTVGNGGGALTAPDLANDGVTVVVSGSGSASPFDTVTLTGSIADINAYIAGNNILWDPPGTSLADRQLQITINDGGHNGSGGPMTATDIMTLHSVSFGTVRDGQVTFGNGDDSLDVHDVNMFGITSIHMGSGSNMLITSPTNMDVGTIFYDTDDTGGDDTGTLLFTPDQFYEIMSTAAFRTELQRYLDGDPGTGVLADTLDLSGSSWNAKVGGLETAWVAFSTGTDYVVYSAIGDNLPDYMTGQTGTDGNNTLVSTAAGQTLNGNGGSDILVAASGGNTLSGGAGSDVLLGGSGADVLNGGTGNDFLFGGKGADTFQFTGAFGNDTVLDFQHGQDVIEFEKTAFSDFADLIAHTTDDGHGTVTITHGSDSVVLKNVSAATLTANDFHFV